ncbi:MAG: hypothetical protein ABEH65_11005 [Halobacteriales archaeon]
MTTDLEAIRVDALLRMQQADVGCLPVVDDPGRWLD